MSKHKHTLDNSKISQTALRLAASKGWSQVTLEAVAKAAKIPIAGLKTRFRIPADLMPVIAEAIDREAFAAAGQISGTPQDMLFDLLMARFDVLQRNRKAILSMAEAARQDRRLSCALTRATVSGVYRLIDAAKLKTLPRPILAAGLGAMYGWVFFVWNRDNSRDMAKTMAAVDRGLRLCSKVVILLQKHR